MKNKAFTLLELMVVVVLISIIASFALPNYRKSLDKAHEKDILNNLYAIHAANQIFYSQAGEYWLSDPDPTTSVDTINDGLGISVIRDADVTYRYDRISDDEFDATGIYTPGGFRLLITEGPIDPGTNPCCNLGACPTVGGC